MDIPPGELEATDHRAMEVCCTNCGASTQGTFPEHVTQPVQYGNGIKAVSVYAMTYQMIPLERTCELLRDLFRGTQSDGTLMNWQNDAAKRLAPVGPESSRQSKVLMLCILTKPDCA